MLATDRAEERIMNENLEKQRLQAAGDQRERALELLEQNKQTIKTMMVQFDSLMTEGIYNVLYNGGTGDIASATGPSCGRGNSPTARPIPLRMRECKWPCTSAISLRPSSSRP